MSAGSSRDNRYDVVLREPNLADPGVGYQVDTNAGDLPLLLTDNGSLGFTVGLTSPYGGRLSQGDLQDADLSNYTARTQRDWRGGRAHPESYQATDAYTDGTLNALIPGRLISGISGNTPAFLGSPSTTTADPVTLQIIFFDWGFVGGDYWIVRKDELMQLDTTALDHVKRATLTHEPISWAILGNLLYVAYGDSVDIASVTPSALTETAITGHKASYLLEYNQYLYALTKDGDLEYFNGTAWQTGITIGQPGYQQFTGLVGFQNQIIFAATNGLWSISADIPYQVVGFKDLMTAENGRNLKAWAADGLLYIPIQDKLMAWNGAESTLIQVFPDALDEIPPTARGPVSSIATTHTLFFFAVDAGASGYSSIYAKAEGTGWHLFYRSTTLGARIRSVNVLAFETGGLTFQMLVWYENGQPKITPIVDELLDLQTAYTSTPLARAFSGAGSIVGSWTGTELRRVGKQISAIVISAETFSTYGPSATSGFTLNPATILVELECDRTGVWSTVGTITFPTERTKYKQYELGLAQPALATTVVSYNAATPSVTVTSATGIVAGNFLRIGQEVRQVINVVGSVLTLQRAFDTAPVAGQSVFGSLPICAEFRYRMTFSNATYIGDPNTVLGVPMVHSVTAKYQDQLIEKYRYTLQIQVGSGDIDGRMRDRMGGAYPYTANQLRARLRELAKRQTPMRMQLPTGDLATVKVANLNESQFNYQPAQQPGIGDQVKSMAILSLIEV